MTRENKFILLEYQQEYFTSKSVLPIQNIQAKLPADFLDSKN